MMVGLVLLLVIKMFSCFIGVMIERLCFISLDVFVMVMIWWLIFIIWVLSWVLSRWGVIRLMLGFRLLMFRNSWLVCRFCSVVMVWGLDSEYELGCSWLFGMMRLMCGIVVSSVVMFSVLVMMFSEVKCSLCICLVIFLVVEFELSRMVLLLWMSFIVLVVMCIF